MESVFILFGSERFLCGAYATEGLATAALIDAVRDQTDDRPGSPDWLALFDEYEIVETVFVAGGH